MRKLSITLTRTPHADKLIRSRTDFLVALLNDVAFEPAVVKAVNPEYSSGSSSSGEKRKRRRSSKKSKAKSGM